MAESKQKPKHLLCAIPQQEPAEALATLRERFPDYKITYIHTKNENLLGPEQGIPESLFQDVTVLFTLGALPPLRMTRQIGKFSMHYILAECLASFETSYKCTGKPADLANNDAGTNHIQSHPIYKASNIPICIASGIHGPAISEWIVMCILIGAHKFTMMHEWQRAKSWGPPNAAETYAAHKSVADAQDLAGQRIGILGYGGIGRQVARAAAAMGMEVYAYTSTLRTSPQARRRTGYTVPGLGDPDGVIPIKWFGGPTREELHMFLGAGLDVLVVSTPLTEQTRHLLGEEEFELLAQRNAFVVNISRGQIIKQEALIAALHAFVDDSKPENQGKRTVPRVGRLGLRGAALDVTDPEPLPRNHPLFSAPNCIVTPHISVATASNIHRAFDLLAVNIGKLEAGEPLVNVIDKTRGY